MTAEIREFKPLTLCMPSAGDLTSTLALGQPPDTSVPQLPLASLGDLKVVEQAVLTALVGPFDLGLPYPIPAANSMPLQEAGPPVRPFPGHSRCR